MTISTVEVPFNINVDLPGAAFGMIAQNPQALELARSWHLQLGGASIPDEDEADHILKMSADGTGLEWGPMGVGGGWFDADYDPDTGEITITADFASTVTFSYADPTSILSIGTDSDAQFLNKVYPVGSIYMSINATDPGTLFGGTWERIQDTFLLAAGATYAAGNTGGEATHVLTESEMPSHYHEVRPSYGSALTSNTANHGKVLGATSSAGWVTNYDNDDTTKPIQTTGGGGAHNNMPPYLAVYVWKRVS